jgi:hypothetical protein
MNFDPNSRVQSGTDFEHMFICDKIETRRREGTKARRIVFKFLLRVLVPSRLRVCIRTVTSPVSIQTSIACALLIAGCTTAHVREPLTKTLAGNQAEAQGEFWYQLARRPIASNDETFHALLLYLDGKDDSKNYTDRVKTLQSRQMLPAGFNGGGDDAADRGTLAVALDKMLKINGGLTMHLFGASPRYALRAAVDRGILPPSSPNQGFTGGEFVGIMQKAEEFQHGNPSDNPVGPMPLDIKPIDASAAGLLDDAAQIPMYLDDIAATAPTSAPVAPSGHLKAIVTGTQGDLVEIRPDPAAAWKHARPGMVLHEGTEIRTGPKSSIRFLIPSDEAFALDSQGSMTLAQAVVYLKKARTRIDLDRGRLREDLSHTAPVQIEEAGIEHDTVIKSPNSALALRGTKVSLFEQPSFDPIAVSLTGQAFFTNTDGLKVPFGGRSHVVIVGNQTSPAQQADARASAVITASAAITEFETRELSIVSQRGGFQRGDVIVGDLSINDFKTLPGVLDFVLQWSGGAAQMLNDLNLAVFSPLDPAITKNPNGARDYVANPPFTISLTPNSPASKEARATLYPQSSKSGGQISTNSVGPDGLELASWGKNFPVGTYGVVVYNLVDAKTPPKTITDVVPYTVDVYLNGQQRGHYAGSVGLLQTGPLIEFNVASYLTTSSISTASQKIQTDSSAGLIRSRKH